MTPERFRQVRNLFEAALERPPEDRSDFVSAAVGSDEDLNQDVLRMLAAHEREVTFFDGTLTASPELRTDPKRLEGRRLGPFEILSEIGRGGMGTVYLARRADGVFEQRVAVKVVTPGGGTDEVVRRFKQERAILAGLEHVNIARIYDGGTTEEGWPYFVMEYVDGKRIDEWCDQRRLNISSRVRLFQTVCAAVHYAHQHGVIHRDLKPANIFVTNEGTVKLLDFGIAKVVRSETQDTNTQTLLGMMTPEYASPEQFRGEETTPATDVYALGVILYELLTGRRPYRMQSRVFREFVRVVCEDTPARASKVVTDSYEEPISATKTRTIAPAILSASREGTPIDLKRRLTGDLDSILSKTLEKASRDRYRSAEQLSSDLARHLNGKPILASQQALLDRVGPFISRHRFPIVLGCGLVTALVSGAIRVEWAAVAYFAAALVLLGLWMAATNQKFGAVIHNRLYGKSNIIALIVVVAVNVALIYWSGSIDIAHERFKRITAAFYLGSVVWAIGGIISWSLRERWAGTLLMSQTFMTRTRAYSAFLIFSSVDITVGALTRLEASWSSWMAGGASLATILSIRLVASRLEVRDRGVVFQGNFYSWLQIEGYSWDGPWNEKPPKYYHDLPSGTECLRLTVRRRSIFFRPFVNIPVLQPDVAIVDNFVRRNLCPLPVETLEVIDDQSSLVSHATGQTNVT